MSYHPIENISERRESSELFIIGLSLLLGLILALLPILLGPITLPIVFFVFIVLPWLLQDAFRLFIWLIVTWPLLDIFVRVELPAGVPDITYARVMVLLLVCIIILELLMRRRHLLKITTLDFLALIYIVTQTSSRLFVLWFGGVGSFDLNGLLDIVLIPISMYWIIKNLLSSQANIKWFLYGIVIVSLFICFTGLYEQVVGAEYNLFTGMTRWMDVPGGRAAGVLDNPAIFGATLGMGILASMVCLNHAKGTFLRITYMIVIAILYYGVFASYTRSAWLSVFMVLFTAQFFIGNLWKKILPILVVGLLVLIPVGGTILLERVFFEDSITTRVNIYQVAWEHFLEKPIFGWGYGAIDTFGIEQVGYSSHDIYLSFLVDGGVIMLISFLAIAIYLLVSAMSVYSLTEKNSINRNSLVVVTGFILIFLMSGLVLELRFFGYFNVLFWISAGVIEYLRSMVRMDRSANLKRFNDRYPWA